MAREDGSDELRHRLAALSPAKRRLLEERLAASTRSPAPRPDVLPLTFAQERLWILDRIEGPSAAYNIPLAAHLRGTLAPDALAAALGLLMDRHEILRTGFPSGPAGAPFQEILTPCPVPLVVHDLRDHPAADRLDECRRRLAAAARAPFVLAEPPVWRCVLIRLGEEEGAIAFVLHHIVGDAVSAGILVEDLGEILAALREGRSPRLPALPLQVADLAVRERSASSNAREEADLAWWREALAGAPLSCDLPPDHPRPALVGRDGSQVRFSIPPRLVEDLARLASAEQATPFMALLALHAAVLARWSGAGELLVGVPVATRPPGSERLVGFFVNTLPVRIHAAGADSFRERVRRARDAVRAALERQSVPFERIVSELAPPRDPSRNPVVQHVLAFQNVAAFRSDLAGLAMSPFPIENGTAKFDLTLIVEPARGAGGWEGILEYRTDLFTESTVKRFRDHWIALLSGSLADPDRPLAGVASLTPRERALLASWQGGPCDPATGRGLAALFEEQVDRAPEAPAVRGAFGSLSYRALDAAANRVAHDLVAAGLGPGSLVAVTASRSPATIAGILGILKAGAAYLPLERDLPRERFHKLVGLAGVTMLLQDGEQVGQAADGVRTTYVVRIDPAGVDPGRLRTPAADAGEAAAYVMFTSGSTGEPKGVRVPHRAVIRLVRGVDFIRMDASEVFLLLAPLSFDASTLEIWAPLLNGGTLAIPPDGPLSLSEIAAEIGRHGVTSLWLTAGLFHLMVEEQLPELGRLRQLLAGGDVLSPPHVNRLLAAHPHVRFVNGYGPTENTTFTCCHVSDPGRPYSGSIPIGHPLPGTRLLVLGPGGEAVPVGAPGELYVGGMGLALDYLGRPDLTEERFVPDPESDRPGARLYRTGDRVRWRPDGELEFLGRIDQQVKIRGYRIEPGEIESALRSLDGIREAAVVVREDRPGRKELVAYIAGPEAEAAALAGSDARKRLEAELPAYMLPSALVPVPSIPLTPNGKLDRAALPDPVLDTVLRGGERSDLDAFPDGPDSAEEFRPAENALAELFREVLGIARFGPRDSFFDLGGNSLLATRLASLVRTRLGTDIPLREFFLAPTVRALADRIGSASSPGPATRDRSRDDTAPWLPPTDPIPLAPRDRSLPLSAAQERLWFLARLEPDNPFYNVATALELRGRLNVEALASALMAVVERHEILRTTYDEEDGRPVQVVGAASRITIARIDLAHEPDPQGAVRRAAVAESRKPFNLRTGPVVRATLLSLGPERHVLLFTMHHIASDGWSLGVLVGELAAGYRAACSGMSPASVLPPLACQYADYAAWQRSRLDGAELERLLAPWKRRLHRYPPELRLPTDRPRPTAQSFRGGSVEFQVPHSTVDALRAIASERRATLFMALLAGFGALLSRLSGQDDLVIGTPIAGRTRPEIEPLIGFFVNTLALRVDASGTPGFGELVDRAREVTLEAYEFQALPFERLVDELQPERDLGRNPLFQVMLALQNAPFTPPNLPGLEVAPLEFGRTTAQFDLVLDLWERPEGDLLGILEYASDLFDRETIERLAGHFVGFLASAVAAPYDPVAALPYLRPGEQERLLALGTGPRVAYPVHRTLVELFEEEVARGAGRTATEDGRERWTYERLNAESNRIARFLRDLGVRPGEFVGLGVERGVRFHAGLLGILKAGAAYVPLDTSYPPARIAYMLSHSAVRVLVTEAAQVTAPSWVGLVDGAPELREVVLVDEPAPPVSASPGREPRADRPRLSPRSAWIDLDPSDLPRVNGPRDPAYMLYTSGSTGAPKGAVIRHDGKINHIHAQFRRLEFSPESAFLQSAPASSDISVWQYLGPVLCGGRTVVAAPEDLADPARLFALIRDRGVTIVELVPILMSALLAHARSLPADARALPALRWALITGEAAPVAVVNEWLHVFPGVRLVNAYGPTEAADDVCEHEIGEPLPGTARSVPIGTPLDNLAMYVLDERLALVPQGVTGEICVSGIGVGDGYWRDEPRTRAAFVPNPFAGEGRGDVLYRTGDYGFWRRDGILECQARVDDQVKIRGHRIEPAEIEAVLGGHDAVRDVAVGVARAGDELALVAGVVPDPDSPVLAAAIAELAEERVAEWHALHDNSYRDTLDYGDPTFNVIGWDSNYTGLPLSREEMVEYVAHTVGLACEAPPSFPGTTPSSPGSVSDPEQQAAPGRVLEIGCGTGLIFFALLPRSSAYTAIDLSDTAVDRLRALQEDPALQSRIPGLSEAVIRQGRADDLAFLPAAAVDTVLLPSVVQYFPSIAYVRRVLGECLRVLAPGGRIVLGDLRSLPLLETFHASVQLARAAADDPTSAVIARTARRLAAEQELAVHPDWFRTLPSVLPGIARVEVRPKRGTIANEMTRFRYDVVLHAGGGEDFEPSWRDAATLPGQPADWERWIAKEPVVAIRGIGNARTARDRRLVALLADPAAPRTAGALQGSLDEGSLDEGLLRESAVDEGAAGEFERARGFRDPEELVALADRLGRRVYLEISSESPADRIDAVFVDPRAEQRRPRVTGSRQISDRDAANDPLGERIGRVLGPLLKAWLRERLPAYMIPARFLRLAALPLTPAGKVDRRAVAELAGSLEPGTGEDAEDALVPPRTPIEEALVAIWREVLGVDRVGIRHDFFDLGGHSLKATQVVSRIHRDLGILLPVRALFATPILEDLARVTAEAVAARERSGEEGPAAAAIPSRQDGTSWDGGSIAYAEIAGRPYEGPAPLSHAQRRLWVLSRMEGGTAAYNAPASLRLRGAVNIFAFEAALNDVVARHESLRTVIGVVEDEPRQIVRSQLELQVSRFDLAADPDPEAAARRLALEDAARPFDLERGPLLRAALLALGPADHVFLFNMHHIISDDWSLAVFAREFMDAYGRRAHATSRESPAPPPRIQYRDYAAWQNASLEEGRLRRSGDWWRATYRDLPPALDLPADRPRPGVKTYAGATLGFPIPPVLAGDLRRMARERSASLFMVLVATVYALLHRLTHQDDLVIGFPIAGRNHPDLEGQIGFFINTLPLRVAIDPDASFEELLASTARSAGEAYDHQSYPFDRLVDDLALRRDVSRNPLFDVVVVLQNATSWTFRLPGLEAAPFVSDYPGSKFDLHFVFEESADRIDAAFVYNTDLFDRDRIERLRDQWLVLVRSALEAPATPVGTLPWMPADQRALALRWAMPSRPVEEAAEARTLVSWYRESCRRHADREAVCCRPCSEDGVEGARIAWTYRDLAEKSDRVARCLAASGVRRGSIVGLYLDRTPHLAAAVAGILESGGAYLPIELAYPPDRIAFMLRDSGAAILLTERALAGRVNVPGVRVVLLEDALEGPAPPGDLPDGAPGPDDLAYIIYTSGSTGEPKGCPIRHRHVVRLFRETEAWFGFGAEDAWTLFHSIAFDFSVWELWGALLYGGRLVVVPRWVARSPSAFHALLARERVTVLNQTPSAFRALSRHEEEAGVPAGDALRLVIFGGEALELEALRTWFDRRGDDQPRLVNMYGITETTVHVTYRPIVRSDLARRRSVIGRPIPDLGIVLLDSRGQLVPPGIPGEIHVAGAGVAGAYWKRPDLTAARFVDDPLHPGSGPLYRSGDLAVLDPDGEIVYLGRIDHQVKVRGFRIELGEIEAALLAVPGIAEALVRAREEDGETRITAWIVPSPGATHPDAARLRSALAARLPDYMIPSRFLVLDRIPLTSNGKVDSAALDGIPVLAVEGAAEGAAPANETEEIIAGVVSARLGVSGIDPDRNWFDLGAQSLLLVRIHRELVERLGRPVPLVALYQHPTVRRLAAFLDGMGDDPAADGSGTGHRARRDAAERARKARESRKRR